MKTQLAAYKNLADSLTLIHFKMEELKKEFPPLINSMTYMDLSEELETLALCVRNSQKMKAPHDVTLLKPKKSIKVT